MQGPSVLLARACGVSRESESHFYFMVCYLLTEAAIARTGGDAASLQDIETERTGQEKERVYV